MKIGDSVRIRSLDTIPTRFWGTLGTILSLDEGAGVCTVKFNWNFRIVNFALTDIEVCGPEGGEPEI